MLKNTFMSHGHCYLWDPIMLIGQVLSNLCTGIAYFSIAGILVQLLLKLNNYAWRYMVALFAFFIGCCGLTHLCDVYMIWQPYYWFDLFVRCITALASLLTMWMLIVLRPQLAKIVYASQLAQYEGFTLASAIYDLSHMYQKAKQLERQKSEFFASLSHELRTPLTLIISPMERLLESADITGSTKATLQIMKNNALVLLGHINDLLKLARSEEGALQPHYTCCDFGTLMQRNLEHFSDLANERNIDLKLTMQVNQSVCTDVAFFNRMITNLLGNAFCHTPNSGSIYVQANILQVSAKQICLQVEVHDSGPGVPQAQRPHLFRRFFRGCPSHRGIGLGLAIVHELAESLGGKVWVDDSPLLGGALFGFSLPHQQDKMAIGSHTVLFDNEHDNSCMMLARLGESPPEHYVQLRSCADPQAQQLLVVEDHKAMNDHICAIVGEHFRVVAAFSVEQAQKALVELDIDMVLSDLSMPDAMGDSLLLWMQQQQHLQNVPLMFLTAQTDIHLRIKMLKMGANDYIIKPFMPAELMVRLENMAKIKRTKDILQGALLKSFKDLDTLADKLARQHLQLQDSLVAAQKAQQVAEDASDVKSNFLTMIGHELRSAMTALQLPLQRLEKRFEKMAPSEQPLVRRTLLSAQRLHGLLESLFERSRLQHGHLSIRPEPFNVRTLIEQVIEDFQMALQEKNIAINLHPSPLPNDTICSDKTLVRMIVTNLLSNAIKFSPSDQSIVISVETLPDRHWVIGVQDFGPGIDLPEQAHIFQPFVHLEPIPYKHTPGMGLGLALVAEMVGALGGDVQLRSSSGSGATFIVKLPSLQHQPNLSH